MYLTQKGWKTEEHDYATMPSDWSKETKAAYLDWLAARKIEKPEIIKCDSSAAQVDVRRYNWESKREYRRRIRRELKLAHGSLSKKRAADRERKRNESAWMLSSNSGLALIDIAALRFFIKKACHRLLRSREGIGLNESVLYFHKVMGETKDMFGVDGDTYCYGVNIASLHAQETKPIDMLIRHRRPMVIERERMKNYDHREQLRQRLTQAALESLCAASRKAAFVFRNGFDVRKVIQRSASPDSCVEFIRGDSRRRRGRGKKHVALEITLSPNWWAVVYLRGLANIFGDRTLVVDAVDNKDGTITVTAIKQPGRVKSMVLFSRVITANADGGYTWAEAYDRRMKEWTYD